MKRPETIIAAVLLVSCVGMLAASPAAARDTIFTLNDPRGDDFGDGSFLYPEGGDLQPGDLDLIKFRASRVEGGTEFEVTFANTVKKPERRPLDGFIMLTDLARHGFYNLNVDIYIDTDRKPGSGRINTLPGREAEIHPDSAWEKAICLTPRPDAARAELRRIWAGEAKREIKSEKGTVTRADMDVAKEQIAVDVADDVFFPTRIQVSGKSIRFFVPVSFLGGIASADWSYVVAVSGCDLEPGVQTSGANAGYVGVPFTGLMILPVKVGGSRYTFGSREPDVDMLPPLADLIVPKGVTQKSVLRSFDVLAGRLAQLLGTVPGK